MKKFLDARNMKILPDQYGCIVRQLKKELVRMRSTKATKAFEEIAKHEGISVSEVREEIQKVIDIAMKSDDPKIRVYWRKMPCKGEKPTPEEVVMCIAKQVKQCDIKERTDRDS